ncbi:MAG: DUF4190 domain-containing protein [Deltaproteobacteria bacterium]|nr:DUF4190 domain-containing protein [Deltaproteobacteria bacterium]
MEDHEKTGPKSQLALSSLILGIVSFIPLIGVGIGASAIILGTIALVQLSKNMKLRGKRSAIAGIVLGGLGIVFTVALYGSLYYFGFQKDTPFNKVQIELNQNILMRSAGMLELYKKKFGKYPETLEEAIKAGFTLFPQDAFLNDFYYDLADDKQSYELRSLGPDKKYGTEDDILLE